MGTDLEDRREYLKAERIMRELAKDVSIILETYNFTLVEWKKEGNTIKLIAERGRSRMELKILVNS